MAREGCSCLRTTQLKSFLYMKPTRFQTALKGVIYCHKRILTPKHIFSSAPQPIQKDTTLPVEASLSPPICSFLRKETNLPRGFSMAKQKCLLNQSLLVQEQPLCVNFLLPLCWEQGVHCLSHGRWLFPKRIRFIQKNPVSWRWINFRSPMSF